MDNREMQLIAREQCMDAREKQLASKEVLLNSREKQIFHALKSLESRLESGLNDIETQSSISANQTRLSYTTTFIFSAEAVLWGALLGVNKSRWPIVVIVTAITIVIYEFWFRRHNKCAMKLTKEKNEQKKVIRRVNVNLPSVLSFAKDSIYQYKASRDSEMQQHLYCQIVDCSTEVLDALSELFLDGFAQVVIVDKETRKEYIPRYRIEKILIDIRTVIVFLCDEERKGLSFGLSPNALDEIKELLWVDNIEIPVSIVGRFNAILDIVKNNEHVGYVVNQGIVVPLTRTNI